jgi:hypothetical protein
VVGYTLLSPERGSSEATERLKFSTEITMSTKSIIGFATLLSLLTVMNGMMFLFNASTLSRAAVAGMSYQQLINDPDFTRAVKSIVTECKVNVDVARLFC